jgi:hypothetical protein
MANIKWTGIEQKKYGLTAMWYVSAYYGNDTDVDAVGLYDPSTNPTGHGGPTRPFATYEKLEQEPSVLSGHLVVFDSALYSSSLPISKRIKAVGDGIVVFNNITFNGYPDGYNVIFSQCSGSEATKVYEDCIFLYSSNFRSTDFKKNILIESSASILVNVINCLIIKSTSSNFTTDNSYNNVIIDCPGLSIGATIPRPTGAITDYSIIIGTVKTSTAINGKTTGVTIEDFKADGNYFVKSYSEVDLFGNVSGSGASVAQINEIFNNYYSPIYIDDWQNADFTLKPTANDRVKFGGLNGTYIGAKPVGYRFSASDLWNTHIDSGNTSNLEYDMVNNAIVLSDGFDVGTYRSVRISMLEAITVDLVAFMANFVYNIEGTAKQGVANQRIDTTVDLQPDNTANQRVVYDYRLQVAPNTVDALSVFKDYELNREPTIDASGNSQLNDLFDDNTEQKQVVQDFIIEFTIRRVIID